MGDHSTLNQNVKTEKKIALSLMISLDQNPPPPAKKPKNYEKSFPG